MIRLAWAQEVSGSNPGAPTKTLQVRPGNIGNTFLRSGYNASLWAMEHQLREFSETVSARIKALRIEVEKEFGFTARFSARSLGPILLWTCRREERRLARGQTYEPPHSASARIGYRRKCTGARPCGALNGRVVHLLKTP